MPLGVPVVPDVYITVARSSMRTASEREATSDPGMCTAREASSLSVSTSGLLSDVCSMLMIRRSSGSESRWARTFCSCRSLETITAPDFEWRSM